MAIKPPSPQHPVKRFNFFLKHKDKYSAQTFQTELQRFAFTPEGRRQLMQLQEEAKRPKSLEDLQKMSPNFRE